MNTRKKLLAVLTTGVVALCASTATLASEATLVCDAFTKSNSATSMNESKSGLAVRASSGALSRSFIRFDLSVKLEMQNAELRHAQQKLAASAFIR